jgi:hypothetical protein
MKDKEAIAREVVESFGGLNIPFNQGHFEVMTKRVVSAITEWEKQQPKKPSIHNKKMLAAIESVIIEHSGNGELAEYVCRYLSAEISPPAETPAAPSDSVKVLGQKERYPLSDASEMRCVQCGTFTTWLLAGSRKWRMGRCASCDGTLLPTSSVPAASKSSPVSESPQIQSDSLPAILDEEEKYFHHQIDYQRETIQAKGLALVKALRRAMEFIRLMRSGYEDYTDIPARHAADEITAILKENKK